MSCRYCRERLSAYLDEELTTEERDLVQEHLDSCSHCFSEYRSLSETKRALASLGARCSREEIERLLQTDVGVAVRHYANMPVSPRTVAAAILSVVGIFWVATTRGPVRHEEHGVPLPEGAYLIPVAQTEAIPVFTGNSVILTVREEPPPSAWQEPCQMLPMGSSVVGSSVTLCAPPPQPVRPTLPQRTAVVFSASVWTR